MGKKKIDTAITIPLVADEKTKSRFGFITNRTFCENIQKEFLPTQTIIKETVGNSVNYVQLHYKNIDDMPVHKKRNNYSLRNFKQLLCKKGK